MENRVREEQDLLKKVFENNEELLKKIRTLFFGLEVSREDKEFIRSTFKNDELFLIFKRRLLPTIEYTDVPIGQVVDLWSGVEVRGLTKDLIYQAVESREKLIEMTKIALELLKNPDGAVLDLRYSGRMDIDDLKTKFIARNSFISHIETQLNLIKLIASKKEQTDLEKLRAQAANSSK